MAARTNIIIAFLVIAAIAGAAYYASTNTVTTTTVAKSSSDSSTSSTSTQALTSTSSTTSVLSSVIESTTSMSSVTSSSTSIITTSLTSSASTTSSTTTTTPTRNYSSWTTYHGSDSRVGVAPGFNSTFHGASLNWQSKTLDGMMYAEPLVFNGSVFVATEGDSVYSINDTIGSINWKTNLGQPVPLSSLPCGDIDPIGITSTPVIDNGVLYASAFLEPGNHVLFALNVTNGQVLWHRTIDPSGMNVMYQQQRAGLVAADGFVYVGFGGLSDDCGTYLGWVVGAPENDSGGLFTYHVPTASGGAIWGPSGIAYDNQTNELFVTTGNSASNSTFDYGESVIALTPSLHMIDYFAPTNWVWMNVNDVDLSSVGPTLLGNNTIFQIGKQGIGFLLNQNHIGGIGGQLFSSNICVNDAAFGGVSYSAPYLFVPCRTTLVALNVNLTSETFSKVWNVTQDFSGPPIVADGAVWNLDVNNGTLFAYNMTNGSLLFSYQAGYMGHFETPSAGDGQIFVAANDTVEAFSAF